MIGRDGEPEREERPVRAREELEDLVERGQAERGARPARDRLAVAEEGRAEQRRETQEVGEEERPGPPRRARSGPQQGSHEGPGEGREHEGQEDRVPPRAQRRAGDVHDGAQLGAKQQIARHDTDPLRHRAA